MVPAIIPKEDFTDVSDDTSPTYPIYLTYLVIKAKEAKIAKEVISCDISPVPMFTFEAVVISSSHPKAQSR